MVVGDSNGQPRAASGASDIGPLTGERPETFTMEGEMWERGGREKSKECPR